MLKRKNTNQWRGPARPERGRPRPAGGGSTGFAIRLLRRLALLTLTLTGLMILALTGTYLWLVVLHPGEEIRQSNIEAILSRQSPVYYNDGLTPIGVFFQDAHRQYVPYALIPDQFVNAIVAAEDNGFFSHHGIDFRGIIRAAQANIRAGRVVQGGSTITQQTAKNLFKRQDRSVRAKLKELLYALRLEYHYPKEKILEFYANQFYVSGNGHGLGVAAKYYFDKQPGELDLLECAFIAGSVKQPNHYNPFIQKDAAAAEAARQRAGERADYVLERMHQLRTITAAQFREAGAMEIAFKRGAMSYPLNTLMDLAKEALAVPEVEEALSRHGIENVATSGLRVVTTVERELQDHALTAVRRELSRLDVQLLGYDRREIQDRYRTLLVKGDREIETGAFLFGTITRIDRSGEPEIEVLLDKNGRKGRIDAAGVAAMLESLVKWHRERWSTPGKNDLPLLLDQLEAGDTVYVSVRALAPDRQEILLDLEKYPTLQGGLMVLRDGAIRAMVGGTENHYYNRAVAARRSMGSVMKPLVYAAALQLGWNSVDPLNNGRDLFVYQRQAYFPRPDHRSPHDRISMNWAGVHSENLASVWLLYHLCDRLSPAEFKELLGRLDLDRREGESYGLYKSRIRDRYGVMVDRDALRRIAYRQAIAELEPDLLFSGRMEEFNALRDMHYGLGFDLFSRQIDSQELEEEIEPEEAALRRRILANNYLRHLRLRRQLEELQGGRPAEPEDEEAPPAGRLFRHAATGGYRFTDLRPDPLVWSQLGPAELAQITAGAGGAGEDGEDGVPLREGVLIGESLTAPTIDQLEKAIAKHLARLTTLPDYSPEVLYQDRDFRVLAGLSYLIALSRELGIGSPLEPVLSFPLGSNVISLLETARIYESLVTGVAVRYGPDENTDPLAIIDRIEAHDGTLIYAPTRARIPVIAPRTTLMVQDILRNTVQAGTGRYAYQQVRMHSRTPQVEEQLAQLDLPLPLLGKTGTTNRFTNAAFAGFVPARLAEGNGLTLEGGYAVAAYAGFDDNTPMVRRSTRITGASGGLPIWSRMANAILLEKEYGAGLDLVDLAFTALGAGTPEVPLRLPDLGQNEIAVDQGSGLPARDGDGATTGQLGMGTGVVTFGSRRPAGEWEPDRFFQPFWRTGP